jgi:hypothetical protein
MMGPDDFPVGSISHDNVRIEERLSSEYLEGDCGCPEEMKFSVCVWVLRGANVGEHGLELEVDRDIFVERLGGSASERSDISGELLNSSQGTGGPQTETVLDVRNMGQDSRPRPYLDGLEALTVETVLLVFLGTTKEQLSHTPSMSRVPLGRRLAVSLSDEPKLGKYELWKLDGERGLVGGVSNGEASCGRRSASFMEG